MREQPPSTLDLAKWLAITLAMEQALLVAGVGLAAVALPLRAARALARLQRRQERD